MKKENLLNVKNINKNVGGRNGKNILDNVSFVLQKEDWIGIIGGNGAGKTSLVEIIAGINKQTSGTVDYNFEFERDFREQIGIQFQSLDFPFALTVKDMIKLAISSRQVKISKSDLNHVIEIFGIKEFYKKKANSLSGGQKQRVNILMSVIHKPQLLILDEFSTGLDIASRKQMIEIIKGLKQSMKISGLVITHHLSEIEELCNKMIILEDGKLIDTFNVSDIVKKYGSVNNYVSKHVLKGGDENAIHF